MEVAEKGAILPEVMKVQKVIASLETLPRKALATPVARAMAKEMGNDINQGTRQRPRAG
jgi:hypothetical protein